MKRISLPVLITSILLASCSPPEYQVNSPSLQEEAQSIPESEQAGYMRILGDLRWDKLTSKEEWMAIFPECLTDESLRWNYKRKYYSVQKDTSLDNDFVPQLDKNGEIIGERRQNFNKKCKDFLVGGIPLTPIFVYFGSNSGTSSKTMAISVRFDFFDNSQSRAFKAALAQKYEYSLDEDMNQRYCSRFTCWGLSDVNKSSPIKAYPTPYTVSLLDQVKLDTSDL